MAATEELVALSIDPGRVTGVAVWDLDEWENKKALPVGVHTFTGCSKGTYFDKSMAVCNAVERLMAQYVVRRAFIEYPSFYQSSGGITTATGGALVKLASFAGAIYRSIYSLGIRPDWVEVNDWKGQMKKAVCKQRILRHLPGLDGSQGNTHTWDAIGIGLHAKGVEL